MTISRKPAVDSNIKIVLYKILLAGILCAIIFLIVGLILLSSTPGVDITEELSLEALIEEISSMSPKGILGIGILLIIATPLIRILTTTIVFLKERDRFLVIISLIVMGIITLGFIQGSM